MTSASRGGLVALCLLAAFLILSKVRAQRMLDAITAGAEGLQATASLEPTEPPPPNSTPQPTPTMWLDAPHNSYIRPVMKPEATLTPTAVPGTPTLVPTEPAGPTPANRAYAPFVIDIASTPTATLEGEPTMTLVPTEEPP